MWMAGYDDEDKFDKFAQTLTLEGLGAKIECPYLIVAGGDDELSPIENSYDLYDEINTPKKIVVYEGEQHGLGNRHLDAQDMVADWFKDRFDGKDAIPASKFFQDIDATDHLSKGTVFRCTVF